MTVVIDGLLGVSLVQDSTITNAKLSDGSVTPVKTQAGALPSMLRLNTANGYGSTNTKIRRFTSVLVNQGVDITYADSATLGATFTINVAGVYAISYNDQFTTAAWMGISLNAANGATAIESLPVAEVLCTVVASSTAGWAAQAATTVYLPVNSVVRAHTGGIGSGTMPNTCQFTITRVA